MSSINRNALLKNDGECQSHGQDSIFLKVTCMLTLLKKLNLSVWLRFVTKFLGCPGLSLHFLPPTPLDRS